MMRGAAALVAMRMAGRVPSIVYLDAWYPAGARRGIQLVHDTWHVETPSQAHLMLPRDVPPDRVDLRCLIGLTVWVQEDPEIAQAIRAACIAAKARRVVCVGFTYTRDGEIVRTQHHWTTDTAGVFTWPN